MSNAALTSRQLPLRLAELAFRVVQTPELGRVELRAFGHGKVQS